MNVKDNGKKKGIKKVSFDIPPGIDTGDYTVLEKEMKFLDGINGDLIVRITSTTSFKISREMEKIFFTIKMFL